jgi:ParB family chromosome partitioning protein
MALGRGLSELLSEVKTAYDNNTSDTSSIYELEIDKIKPNPHQPRKVFDKEKLQELSASILKHGLLQPIIVTKDADSFILIAGERRLKATKLAGFSTIKASVININNNKLRQLALIENIQRDDLNIIELAYSYAGLINEHKVTHEELAQMVSKSRSVITNTLRLLTLSVFTQQMLGSNKITTGHAKLLIGLNEEQQKVIVNSIIGQNLSVRETEKLVKNIKEKKENEKTITNSSKIDFEPLKDIFEVFDKEELCVKTGKNYLKIEFSSNEDVEKFLKLFTKS